MKYYVVVEKEMNGCFIDNCAFDDMDEAAMFMKDCEEENPDIEYDIDVRESRPTMIDVWEKN